MFLLIVVAFDLLTGLANGLANSTHMTETAHLCTRKQQMQTLKKVSQEQVPQLKLTFVVMLNLMNMVVD